MHSIFPGYSPSQGNKPEEKNVLAVTAKSSFYRKGQKLVIYFWKAKEHLSLEEIINKGCRFRFSLQWYFLISALKVFCLHTRMPGNSIPCRMLSKVSEAAQTSTIKLQVSKKQWEALYPCRDSCWYFRQLNCCQPLLCVHQTRTQQRQLLRNKLQGSKGFQI